MSNRSLILLLFLACVTCPIQVYATPSAKPTHTRKMSENQKLKKQVKDLNVNVAKLLDLVQVLKKVVDGLKEEIPTKKLVNAGRIIGVYYKQWWSHHEQLSPPEYKVTRVPYSSNWVTTSKKMTVVKKSDTSVLRITYNCNLRTFKINGGATACIYSIFIDQMPCAKPSQIDGAVFNNNSRTNNPHRQRSIIGICSAKGWAKGTSVPIKKGRHEVRVYVRTAPGYLGAVCHLGWFSSSLLMIEEIEMKK